MALVKRTLKQLLGQVICLFHRRGCIVFESTPDFADNTYPVFCQMVRRGLHEKYTLVWSCSKEQTLPDAPEGTRYIYPLKGSLKEKLRNIYYMAGAKCLISCNRYLVPWRKEQMAIFLSHGTPLKSIRSYYNIPPEIDYCLSAGPGVEKVSAYEVNAAEEKMVSLGFPRNDILTQPAPDVKKLLGTTCQKVLVWYPTFRQHKNGLKAGSGNALPIIHDVDAAQNLNDWAQKQNVLLVLKPHFAQDLSQIKAMELSNIRFIDDSFFTTHAITSYGFVAGCDALITDYSSIYFDYMLCDKPIGLVWEDIEAYRENPGFAVDMEEYGAGGVKIYTLADFKDFLTQVAQGADPCRQERRRLRDLANFAPDGNNAQRVTDFIIEKANL